MKKSRHCGTWQRNAVAVAVASCFVITSPVYANPIGANVVNGVVSMAQQGNTLNITNSPGAIINWQSFSIGMNEATRFLQQSAASNVLNRVTGVDPSSILGALQSNGRVFLINPNGVLFGAGAQVDVAGLVVSTLNLSNADFLAGRYNFTANTGAGGIDNQGNLTALPGGQIYLVAPNLSNSGLITSPQGDVILAAGNSVELVNASSPDMRVIISAPNNQAINLGSIVANSGRIGIYAGLINHHGIVSADTAIVGETGKITFRATRDINLEAGSVTSASGAPGGVHDGGEVRIIADGKLAMRSGSQVRVDGGVDGGNGGFLELSGKHVILNGDISIAAHAPGFRGGRLFIDPSFFTISSGCGGVDCMIPNDVNIALSGGGTVDIQANQDITVANAVTGSGGSGGLLLMRAGNNIDINADIGTSGPRFEHDLTMVAGNDINIRANIYQGSYQLILRAAATAVDLGFAPYAGAPTTGMVNIGPDTNVNNSPVTVDTKGSVWISGKGLTVAGNGYYNGPSVESYSNGYAATLHADGNITIGSKTGDLNSRPMIGAVTIQGGYIKDSGDASATVQADGNIDINISSQLAVRGGIINASSMSNSTADVHAKLYAGNNLTIQADSVEVKGGTFNMASNSSSFSNNTLDASALLSAGNAVSITATDTVEVLGGMINVSPSSYSFDNNAVNVSAAITADAGSVTVNAGSVKVQGGTVNLTSASSDIGSFYGGNTFDAYAKINAASGDVSITVTGGAVEVLGGSINITNNNSDVRYNDVDATALVEGNNVTITAGSVRIAGGAVGLNGGTSSASSNTFNALAKINAASGDVNITASGAVEVLGGGITISGNDYDPFASSSSMVAAAAIAGQNVTIGAGSLKVQGGTISVASNSSSGQYNDLDVSARIEATSGNLGITTTSTVQVLGGDVTFSNNSGGFSFDSNTFYADAKLYATNAVTITSGSLTVAGGSATLSGSPANNYLNLNALVYAGVGDVTLATAGNINVTGGTVNGANASNSIYANATIRAANEVLATVGGTAIAINAVPITGGDYAEADARIESAIPDTIRVSFTNLTSGGYSVNGIDGAITDGNSGFYAFNSPGILDSTLFFQYATPAAALTGDLLQQALNTVTRGALETGALPILNGTLLAAAEPSDEEEKKPTYTCQ